jgi:hypothetical protein
MYSGTFIFATSIKSISIAGENSFEDEEYEEEEEEEFEEDDDSICERLE